MVACSSGSSDTLAAACAAGRLFHWLVANHKPSAEHTDSDCMFRFSHVARGPTQGHKDHEHITYTASEATTQTPRHEQYFCPCPVLLETGVLRFDVVLTIFKNFFASPAGAPRDLYARWWSADNCPPATALAPPVLGGRCPAAVPVVAPVEARPFQLPLNGARLSSISCGRVER